VLRSVTLSVALCVLAAACALFEPPVPPGTVATHARVKNLENFPVELAVKMTTSGVLLGAVSPASLPANGTAQVTFYLPVSGDWWITVNESDMYGAADIREVGVGCGQLDMEVSADGHGGLGCASTKP
jgi:hypothetical protein